PPRRPFRRRSATRDPPVPVEPPTRLRARTRAPAAQARVSAARAIRILPRPDIAARLDDRGVMSTSPPSLRRRHLETVATARRRYAPWLIASPGATEWMVPSALTVA